jgi:hypothetical protein
VKRRGPKRTPGEKELLKQVADVFSEKWREFGSATKAAKDLGINPKSFYKYAHGEDLPRIEVLRAAQRKWKNVRWKFFDQSTLFKNAKPVVPEQLVLPLIQSIRQEDIEIEILPGTESSLQVRLKINFSTGSSGRSKTAKLSRPFTPGSET